jgi:hypothetical protein
MITAESRIAQPFHPRDWVQLTLAFLRIWYSVHRNTGLTHVLMNQWLREGRLYLGRVMPDGTIRVFEASNCQRRTVCAPHNPAEGVRVEP